MYSCKTSIGTPTSSMYAIGWAPPFLPYKLGKATSRICQICSCRSCSDATVVWITDDPNAWDDDRGALQQAAPIVCAVTSTPPDEAFWKAVEETPWIENDVVFIVGGATGVSPVEARRGRRALHFIADPNIPAGNYRVEDKIVRAPLAVVKSVAGGFIANQLKGRNIQQNGRSR